MLIPYVCPECKSPLHHRPKVMYCESCNLDYPEGQGIVDFTSEAAKVQDAQSSLIRKAYGKFFDILAPIYESPAWYQLTLNLSGAKGNSIQTIADFITKTLNGVSGSILDVACGTATYSRRIALPNRAVYGIDLSKGMLRQGARYLQKAATTNVHLARANVMKLPFGNGPFDGAVCAGSIHLFPDPKGALIEIGRTMKVGAPFAVQTFLPKSNANKQSIKNRTGFHEFQPDELLQHMTDAGFGDFTTNALGTVLTVGSRKKTGNS